jgi:hypothetical protein
MLRSDGFGLDQRQTSATELPTGRDRDHKVQCPLFDPTGPAKLNASAQSIDRRDVLAESTGTNGGRGGLKGIWDRWKINKLLIL